MKLINRRTVVICNTICIEGAIMIIYMDTFYRSNMTGCIKICILSHRKINRIFKPVIRFV